MSKKCLKTLKNAPSESTQILTFEAIGQNKLDLYQFKKLIKTKFVNERAEIITTCLKHKILLSKDTLFKLQPNNTYNRIQTKNPKNDIYTIVTKLIEESYQKLSSKEKDEINEDLDKKALLFIFSNKFIDSFSPQLIINLTNDDIIFDVTINEIHFNNGYYDLKDQQFKTRDLKKHYVTNYITRDYKPSTETQRNKLLTHIRKIYPSQKDLDCILLKFGSALTGQSQKDQENFFLLGLGNSGKSFTLCLTQETIGCYFKELQSDTFSMSNAKIDKIINTYTSNPQIRISWVNEMIDTKISNDLFKKFCEGKLQTTKLYSECSHDVKHYSMAIFTANTMPNLQIDTGVSRRVVAYTHKSEFLKAERAHLANDKEHKYIEDKHLMDKLITEQLLDSWFDILASYSYKWLNGETIHSNENFNDTKNTITSSNDIFQDFIDSKVKITNDPNDRIGKNKMHNMFCTMYPKKMITVQQVINSMKEKGIEYNYQLRSHDDHVKGSFIGVTMKPPDDDDFIDEDAKDAKAQNEDINYEELYKKSEAHNRFFRELLKAHQIDLSQYNMN
jgi:hypothetical protein